MGLEIFGIDIQQVVGDALGPENFPEAILIKMTPGARVNPSGGTHPTPTSYATTGMVTAQKVSDIFDATNVIGGDVVIVLTAKLLADAGVEPTRDDRVTCAGVTRSVVDVRTNDARATYFVHAR